MATKIVQLKDEEGNNLYPNVLTSQAGSGPAPEGIQIGSLISALEHSSPTGNTKAFSVQSNKALEITDESWQVIRGGTQTTNTQPYAITITTPTDESWTILLEFFMKNGVRPKNTYIHPLRFRLYETTDLADYDLFTELANLATTNDLYGADDKSWTFMQPAAVSCVVEIPQNTTTNFLPMITTNGAYFYTTGFWLRATLIDKGST